MQRRHVLQALATAPLAQAQAQAQSPWPARPIKLLVGYPPGGVIEFTARVIQDDLEAALGQPLVLDYRPGQGGMAAAAEVARAAPDGYTLLMGNAAPLVIAPALSARPPFDALAQFTYIAQVLETVFVVVVRAEHPAQSLRQFIDWARSSPDLVRYASGGVGTSGHMNGELLNQAGGLAMQHAPYSGSTPGLADLIAGQVHVTIESAAALLPEIRRGRLRALAITAAERDTHLPQVPTVREEGLPLLESSGFQGLMGPPGLPASIVQRLSRDVLRVLDLPSVARRFDDGGHRVRPLAPAAFTARVRAEAARWSAFIRERRLRGD